MMLFPKKRAWIGMVALFATTLAGTIGGDWYGRRTVRRQMLDNLRNDSFAINGFLDEAFDESRAMLEKMNALKLPDCSKEQLDVFRELVFHAHLLRDAGRFSGDGIACSALHLPSELPKRLAPPEIARPDKLWIYINRPPYLPGSRTGISGETSKRLTPNCDIVRLGNSFVVSDPNVQERETFSTGYLETTMVDTQTGKRFRVTHQPFHVPGAVYDHDVVGIAGRHLYATKCSLRNQLCSTVSVKIGDVEHDRLSEVMLYTALGTSFGLICGLILSLLRQRNLNIEQQLRRAIRRNEVRLVYQPIVDLKSCRWTGVEALARWEDEDGFAVNPEFFFRLAQQCGFVNELTESLVNKTLADVGPVLREHPEFCVHINVTAHDLADPDFVPMLDKALLKADVAAGQVHIEITESSTARRNVAIEAIRELRSRGHKVEIDDFGTGYSSLVYLKDLHIDAIKIDKGFTQAIGTESVTLSILPQILAMARVLNLHVVAEGIETREQAEYFAACDQPVEGQGWLFSHPLPIAEIIEYLRNPDALVGEGVGVAGQQER